MYKCWGLLETISSRKKFRMGEGLRKIKTAAAKSFSRLLFRRRDFALLSTGLPDWNPSPCQQCPVVSVEPQTWAPAQNKY